MILSVHNINKSFDGKDILRNASFHIEKDEKAAIVGINGAGKTTLRVEFYSPTEEKAALKRDLIAHASRKILLADSSKYGSWSLFNIAHLNELTEIITDSQLDGQTRRTLASLSTRLIIAD